MSFGQGLKKFLNFLHKPKDSAKPLSKKSNTTPNQQYKFDDFEHPALVEKIEICYICKEAYPESQFLNHLNKCEANRNEMKQELGCDSSEDEEYYNIQEIFMNSEERNSQNSEFEEDEYQDDEYYNENNNFSDSENEDEEREEEDEEYQDFDDMCTTNIEEINEILQFQNQQLAGDQVVLDPKNILQDERNFENPEHQTYEQLLQLDETVQKKGIEKEKLDKLIIKKYDEIDNTITTEQNQCMICYEDFDKDDFCIQLDCKHLFHSACINKWLLLNKKCPMCNTEV